MSKALELAKFGREAVPTGAVVGDSDTQTLSNKTFSTNPTISSGTANGVGYLNGSKVLTTGSALTFDGTNFTAPRTQVTTVGTPPASGAGLEFVGGTTPVILAYNRGTSAYLPFTQYGSAFTWGISGGSSNLILNSTGLGIGTASPALKLDVAGSIKMSGGTGTALTWDTAIGSQYLMYDSTFNGLILSGYSGLGFRVSGATTDAMRLDSSGKLGLGTTSPGASLDLLSGTSGMVARFKSTGAYASVVTDNTGTSGGGTFSARQNGNTYAAFGVAGGIEGNSNTNAAIFAETGSAINFYTNGSPTVKATIDTSGNFIAIGNKIIGINGTSVAAGTFAFRNSSGVQKSAIGSYYNIADEGNLEFLNGTTTNMVLTSGGKLLMGTTTPTQTSNLLEVNKSQGGQTTLHVVNTSTSSLYAEAVLTTSAYNTGLLIGSVGGNVTTYGIANVAGLAPAGLSYIMQFSSYPMAINHYAAQPIVFGTGNVERMRVGSTGNIGIGTTAVYNSAKLSVAGSAEIRGDIRGYYASRAGLASGASVTLWSVANGQWGTEVSMTLYVSQRDDGIGALSNATYNITAFASGGVVITSQGAANYGAGKPFSLTASSGSGGMSVSFTNSAGAASTGITMVANVLVGYGAIVWGF